MASVSILNTHFFYCTSVYLTYILSLNRMEIFLAHIQRCVPPSPVCEMNILTCFM